MILFAEEKEEIHFTRDWKSSRISIQCSQSKCNPFLACNKQWSLQNLDKNTFCILKEGNTAGYMERSSLPVAGEELGEGSDYLSQPMALKWVFAVESQINEIFTVCSRHIQLLLYQEVTFCSGLAATELMIFIAAHMVLCFRLVTKVTLIAH